MVELMLDAELDTSYMYRNGLKLKYKSGCYHIIFYFLYIAITFIFRIRFDSTTWLKKTVQYF